MTHTPDRFDIFPAADGFFPLSATDIAQYHTVDRCPRALRLRLFAQTAGESALAARLRRSHIGLELPAPLPLARGRAYEQHINTLLSAAHPVQAVDPLRAANGAVRDAVATLAAGERVLLLQPDISSTHGDWRINGRPDVVLLARSADNQVSITIADIKSARQASAAHHLQVAVYVLILRAVLGADVSFRAAVLYQPPVVPPIDDETAAHHATDAARAGEWFGITDAWCAVPADPLLPLRDVQRILASNPAADGAVARSLPYDALPVALTDACVSCAYQQWCLLHAAESDDLALIPGMDRDSRAACRSQGVHTCAQLAALATLTPERRMVLRADDARVSALVHHPTVGPRLEEWIARAYRRHAAHRDQLPYLPVSTQPSMPRSSATYCPALTLLWVDIQTDPGTGLVWGIGSILMPHRHGEPLPAQQTIETLAAPPTLASERALLRRICTAWDTQRRSSADGADAGESVHVVVWDDRAWHALRMAFVRHSAADPRIAAWSAQLLQPRAYGEPLCTRVHNRLTESNFLDQPVISLAQVGSGHWRSVADDARPVFTHGLFDAMVMVPGKTKAFWLRVRPENGIPSEYCAAAWGTLPAAETPDPYAAYRAVTRHDLERLLAQRITVLAALSEQTAGRRVLRQSGALPALATPAAFVTALRGVQQLERAAVLANWSAARAPHPAARVRAGDALVLEYADADQPPGQRARIEDLRAHAGSSPTAISKCQFVCRLHTGTDLPDIPTQLALSDSLSLGAELLLAPLHPPETAHRSPEALFQSAMRVKVTALQRTPTAATVTLQPLLARGQLPFSSRGETFVLQDGQRYTLDPSVDDAPGFYAAQAVDRLAVDPTANRLFQLLTAYTAHESTPDHLLVQYQTTVADAGIARFDAPGSDYLTCHATSPLLLVQGPPGTGKTFTTAHVVLARICAAMARGQPLRIALSAQTHAAVDALLGAVSDVIGTLITSPDPLFARLREVRLVRYRGNDHTPPLAQVTGMQDKAKTLKYLAKNDWCVVGATPTPLGNLHAPYQPWADLLVLDESSQLALPLALAAATPVVSTGQVVVVGDPRQMPAIVAHDWEHELHPLFREYPVYRSLYDYVASTVAAVPRVQLAESRRVPRQLAAFLNTAIYCHDGIHYHSHQTSQLPRVSTLEPLLHYLLDPAAVMLLVRHDESQSHTKNPLEVALVVHVLQKLIQAGLDGSTGYGVVVPHRMQRAAISTALAPFVPQPVSLLQQSSHVPGIDTVERFQGSQRQVMLVSATESHPGTIARNERFLFDARRLNVALSRAQRKVILIAAQTVFAHAPIDPILQQQPQIWQQYATWCDEHVADVSFHGVNLQISVHRERT